MAPYQIDAGVYDNGTGMSSTVLKVATSFGGSTSFGNRKGIGRFGMGMKTAALSISPIMELVHMLARLHRAVQLAVPTDRLTGAHQVMHGWRNQKSERLIDPGDDVEIGLVPQ